MSSNRLRSVGRKEYASKATLVQGMGTTNLSKYNEP